MKTVKYGGYTIKSFPTYRCEDFPETGRVITMETLQPESSCLSEEHADIFGIDYAKRMIERKNIHSVP